MRNFPALLAAPVLVLALSACSTVGYYWQAADGEYALLTARRPIVQILADPTTPAPLKARLEVAQRARRFASDHLDLPRNGSYTSYADLHRPWAVWNVYATPEFSVKAITHCFPVAGCVAYQGYFSKTAATTAAEHWRTRGDDAAVFGVPTFSTLGWFDDPLLSTMLRWNDEELAGEIFHELAHQRFYVAGDTQFNESYANFVEREGLRQWRAARGLAPAADLARLRADQLAKLMLDTRKRLAALYARKLPDDMLRARKADIFGELHADYLKLRNGPWHGYAGYDAFFEQPLDNARLVPFGLYDQWVPGFRVLFERNGENWPRFYAAVKKLGGGSKSTRDAEMRRLTRTSARANA